MLKKFILKTVLTAFCLAFMAASAQAGLNLADGTASGQWWNPTRDGEGFYIEVIDTGGNLQIGVAMYSYDETGNQLWLVGNVAIADGDQGAKVPVFLIEGPVWGTSYDPADKSTTDFGTITVRFPSCDTALFNVQSNVEGLESGSYSLARATDLVGIDCTNPPPATEDVATPGQWTGEDICFFINTEPVGGFDPGYWVEDNDLCNGFAVEAEVPGVEVYINGDTGPACQAKIECPGRWGITYPGTSTFGWALCGGAKDAAVEIYFTSATDSVVVVYEYVDQDGTLCVGQGGATPAQ